MSTKNTKLEQAAADPALRSATMADFNRQRVFLFWCAMIVTACNLIMCITFARDQDAPTLTALGAVLLWVVVFRIDSQRRTLILLEQLEKAKAERPKI